MNFGILASDTMPTPVQAHMPQPGPDLVPTPPPPRPVPGPDLVPSPEIDDPPLPGQDVPAQEPPKPGQPIPQHLRRA